MRALAKRTKAKIMQASASEGCGDRQVHPQAEDDSGHVNPIGARSRYDERKRADGLEKAVAYFREELHRIAAREAAAARARTPLSPATD